SSRTRSGVCSRSTLRAFAASSACTTSNPWPERYSARGSRRLGSSSTSSSLVGADACISTIECPIAPPSGLLCSLPLLAEVLERFAPLGSRYRAVLVSVGPVEPVERSSDELGLGDSLVAAGLGAAAEATHAEAAMAAALAEAL